MSDPEDFDEVLRNMSRFGETKDSEKIDDMPFRDLEQLEDDYRFSPEDELILGDDYITYLLFAEGRDLSDFSVMTGETGLEVKTEDFIVKKEIGMRVDPEDSTTTYRNGVLSVRLKLISERDAVA